MSFLTYLWFGEVGFLHSYFSHIETQRLALELYHDELSKHCQLKLIRWYTHLDVNFNFQVLQENERLAIVIDELKRSSLDYKNQLAGAWREVKDVSGKFEKVKGTLEESTTDVSRLNNELNRLESEVTALRESKTNKEREVTKLTQKVSSVVF